MCVCVSVVNCGHLKSILPVVCQQVQLSTYKLDIASVQSAAATDVDSIIRVCLSVSVCVVICLCLSACVEWDVKPCSTNQPVCLYACICLQLHFVEIFQRVVMPKQQWVRLL